MKLIPNIPRATRPGPWPAQSHVNFMVLLQDEFVVSSSRQHRHSFSEIKAMFGKFSGQVMNRTDIGPTQAKQCPFTSRCSLWCFRKKEDHP